MWRTEIMMWYTNVRIFHNAFFFFKENSEEMTRTEKNDRFKRQKTETYIRILALSSSEDWHLLVFTIYSSDILLCILCLYVYCVYKGRIPWHQIIVKGLVPESCPTLCDPMDRSLPASSVHGVFQVRILEWAAIPFSRGSSQPRDGTWVFRIVGRRFTIWATREAHLG